MRELNESERQAVDRLDDLEARILDFDRSRSRGEDWRPLVHSLFRDTHNLKSALSMTGRDGASRVMHELETRLDELRSGKALPDDGWTDAMLGALDASRSDLQTAEGGDALDAAAARLRALVESGEAGDARKEAPALEIGFPLTEAEAKAMLGAVRAEERLYILEKLIEAEMDDERIAALPIFDTFGSDARLIAWRVKRAQSSSAVLSILFSTALSADDLSYVVFDPFYPVNAPPRPAAPLRSVPRILIVDDDALTVMILQHYLSAFGRVDTATGGAEAVEKFRASLARDRYAVMFLDIMLPDADGRQTLEILRDMERGAGILDGEGCRIVMASALSDFSSISASFRGQCDAYLVKPFNRAAVEASMRKFGLERIPIDDELVPARA